MSAGGQGGVDTPVFPDLRDKRVLITGGSAGIGKSAALAFAHNGAIVTVLGRRQERLNAVVREMGGGHSVVADLCSTDQTTAAVREAITKMGGLDIVVNSGGVLTEGMWKGDPLTAHKDAYDLHFISALTVCEAAQEELFKNKGSIITISSVAGDIPFPTMTAYGGAKAAQDYLTRALARGYASHGVRVNGIAPGVVNTEVIEQFAEAKGVSVEEQQKSGAPIHLLDRVGAPHEVAFPILFLASSAASFITGVVLPVDGGALLNYVSNGPSITYFP